MCAYERAAGFFAPLLMPSPGVAERVSVSFSEAPATKRSRVPLQKSFSEQRKRRSRFIFRLRMTEGLGQAIIVDSKLHRMPPQCPTARVFFRLFLPAMENIKIAPMMPNG